MAAPADGNAGNQNDARGRTVNRAFKTEEDFYKAQAEAGNDPAKLREISAAWKAQQATGN